MTPEEFEKNLKTMTPPPVVKLDGIDLNGRLSNAALSAMGFDKPTRNAIMRLHANAMNELRGGSYKDREQLSTAIEAALRLLTVSQLREVYIKVSGMYSRGPEPAERDRMFPADYVAALRREAAGYRARAKAAEAIAQPDTQPAEAEQEAQP